jgi:C4-dicarboxylate-specific signal transduction histidine kinase
MKAFRDISIRLKLALLILGVGGAALLLSSAGFVVSNAQLIRSSKVEHLSVLAQALGSGSTAALAFDDPAAAQELLSSLQHQPTIELAAIYDAKGRVFAAYRRELPGHGEPLPPAPAREGHDFVAGGHVDVTRAIVHDGERLGTIFLRSTLEDLYRQLARTVAAVGAIAAGALAVALALAWRLERLVSAPILRLAETAKRISAARDCSLRVEKQSGDELGDLCDAFNAMLDQIEKQQCELREAHAHLEIRVAERTRQLSDANRELQREVLERQRAEEKLREAHAQVVDLARRAGMAEVATGVLHNVGNVLNSVNVSATLVADRLRNSRLADLARALDLIDEHEPDLGRYLLEDERGRHVRPFLRLVAEHLARERSELVEELHTLAKNVDHIKTIVAMQQSYAGAAGLVESISLAELLDDALKLNRSSLEKYAIRVVREYDETPPVRVEKQKLLSILVNLVTNAKDSLASSGRAERLLTARIRVRRAGDDPRVAVEIADNGVGILPENLTRIFSHGFTTKPLGHGFGLHSSANSARELGGSLVAASDGPGQGAVFTLDLPFHPAETPA